MRPVLLLAVLCALSAGCASAPKPAPPGNAAATTLNTMRRERALIRAFGASGLAVNVSSNARIELLVGLAKADIAASLGAPESDQGTHWAYAFFHERAGEHRTLALDFDATGRCTAASWGQAD
ncbi:hypothetical protein FGE12_12655 [Aggregicoccus sp. 17bor-14]|uniref:hypothetical protein n=1 Tax=Myxococcaceae TaxID=31 RepID=UPI00129C2BE0|nr:MULTISPECIES: hypothetical protein [Myxococcaceae]MBF5043242.1 hypothetical protein [Simulacricoccus sp. 17bor-14]MRI88999.1 hypothetical protein [Aggregicoccus sp. 17bor-14]